MLHLLHLFQPIIGGQQTSRLMTNSTKHCSIKKLRIHWRSYSNIWFAVTAVKIPRLWCHWLKKVKKVKLLSYGCTIVHQCYRRNLKGLGWSTMVSHHSSSNFLVIISPIIDSFLGQGYPGSTCSKRSSWTTKLSLFVVWPGFGWLLGQ